MDLGSRLTLTRVHVGDGRRMNLLAWRAPGTRLPNPRVWLKESQPVDCIISPLPLPPFSLALAAICISFFHSHREQAASPNQRIQQFGGPATLGPRFRPKTSGAPHSLQPMMTAIRLVDKHTHTHTRPFGQCPSSPMRARPTLRVYIMQHGTSGLSINCVSPEEGKWFDVWNPKGNILRRMDEISVLSLSEKSKRERGKEEGRGKREKGKGGFMLTWFAC